MPEHSKLEDAFPLGKHNSSEVTHESRLSLDPNYYIDAVQYRTLCEQADVPFAHRTPGNLALEAIRFGCLTLIAAKSSRQGPGAV